MPAAVSVSIGTKFGFLTILNEEPKIGNERFFLCQCDCGNQKVIRMRSLRSSATSSCGCIQREFIGKLNFKNGLYKTRLHSIWQNMNRRCYSPKNPRYKSYGGRGITICEAWKSDFKNFYDWAMANGYSDELSIDRIDVNGNYEPTNCKWASNVEQSNNKTNNRVISYNGETRTISEWAKILGFEWRTLQYRIDSGWDIEKAFTSPLTQIRKK